MAGPKTIISLEYRKLCITLIKIPIIDENNNIRGCKYKKMFNC